MADIRETVVEKLLELVAVGYSPSDPTHQPPNVDESSQTEIECNLDDMCAYKQGVTRGNSATPTPSPAHVLQWRADTAERIYRAYVSAGMTEIPSPDKSPGSALQGSVVPSPPMLATILGVFAAVGNVDQVIILYDTLVATLQHLPSRDIQPGTTYSASYCYGIDSKHKADTSLWSRVLEHICSTQQVWLAARVLEDVAADQWAPSISMYEQYLQLLTDPSEETLATAISSVRDIAMSLAKPAAVIDPLVSALVQPRLPVSLDYMPARVEQALLISGLPMTASQNGSGSTNDGNLVSDETARGIVRALISTSQISRAREFAEIWSQARPELVNGQSIAALIIGLGNAGEHRQALELFANIQESSENDVTVDILSSVLQVYISASDYEEAVSVAKRIRAAVRSDTQALKLLDAGHAIYNYMIRAYCEIDQVTEALRVLEEMRSLQLHATSETYTILVQAMSNIRSYDGLKLIVALADVDYNMVDVEAVSPSETRPLPLTTEYYNALIEAFGRVAEPTKALQIWEMMRQRGVRPNSLTASLLIDTCGWNERVHWDEDMLPQATFVYRDIPEDHVYTGMPFFHLHYLANTLQQLKQSGLEFSVANYCHILEALIRAGFIETALDMTISRYEARQSYEMWTEKSQSLLKPPQRKSLSSFLSMFRPTTAEEDADAEVEAESRTEKPAQQAMFMDDFSIEIPLCQRTVDTVFGMIASVRGQCVQGSNVAPEDMPFVQRASRNLLERLDLHEQRLDEFLRKHRPELLPHDRRES
ncbi:hypothetical protein GGI15_000799 [Coemansia interrupta]|uniref:Pentatricopeptide repeat-containing protein n=1 Tax=Coemansia interrupta TaxID=1126814 RepID=A0A9W8LN51_9FUNG|nr:hypothetical protein GGI15_000799 [Coemansia interrupta]